MNEGACAVMSDGDVFREFFKTFNLAVMTFFGKLNKENFEAGTCRANCKANGSSCFSISVMLLLK